MPFRFWDKVLVGDGCWEWQAFRNEHGYGVFGWRGRNRLAHRVAWELWHGEEPSECILHSCDTPACVRPEHLFEGTQAENLRDMIAKGRGRHPQRSDVCRRGHPYELARGRQICRECRRMMERQRTARSTVHEVVTGILGKG